MKKSIEIKNLPIISIANGIEIGKVKDLVIDPEQSSVDFLTVEQENWQVSVKAIPFRKIIGIGEYAVTVENENAVIDLNEIPIANQLVNRKIKIIDTRLMTRKGQLVGQAIEFFVNDETGQIIGVEINWQDRKVVLSSEFIITLGKDIIVVTEEAVDHFVESITELLEETPIEEVIEEAVVENEEIVALNQKQTEMLLGKRVAENIVDLSGKQIIEAGTILTDADIAKAKEAGPNVFVKLTMSIE
ncbi:PRC-barrel domain-containing protein [Heyndrickxia vini]|uniref:PRC-barrel domain-containing protein n=1 Tax=Heyndrickxia vini TaxID=1476025 RepID=A0ABX7E4N9_9BACI|nr:PRC-barrel domain-containing protein [Heyndrickxia vini]QQZ10704.1 PRC-barrel domain-containing protein [Heyndrickxia vini]